MSRVLVTGGTKKDIDAMAVLALNVRDKTPGLADEMVVFHDGVPEGVQEKFNRIMPARFIRYRCPVPKWKLWQNKIIRYFSPMVFCKYECFRLLDQYETVIWSDYDVVIKEDISELLRGDSSCSFACNRETVMRQMLYPKADEKNYREFDLNGPSICTPLFLLNQSCGDYKEYVSCCYELTKKYIRDIYLPEQCIFTMLVQKYGIPYDEIDRAVYCAHPKDDAENVKILHAYGQPKFWNGLENQQWNRYYDRWKQIREQE